jgi:hypothetical protein
MFLFKRKAGSNAGWEFVAGVENVPRELTEANTEYCYFFISTEI